MAASRSSPEAGSSHNLSLVVYYIKNVFSQAVEIIPFFFQVIFHIDRQ